MLHTEDFTSVLVMMKKYFKYSLNSYLKCELKYTIKCHNCISVTFIIYFLKVNGQKGAMNIVRILKQRAVQLSFVLDEGLAVLDGVISGLEGPAAL